MKLCLEALEASDAIAKELKRSTLSTLVHDLDHVLDLVTATIS